MATVPGFGAELRRLRLEAGLGTRRLAARSAVSRKAVQYFEAGAMRPRRCTIGALAYALDPDDAARHKRIMAALVAAVGGEEALAADGDWPSYRKRRFEQGLLNGSVLWPGDIGRRLAALQRADALRQQASRVLDQPRALDDADALDLAIALYDEARRLSDIGGRPITVHIGGRAIRAWFGVEWRGVRGGVRDWKRPGTSSRRRCRRRPSRSAR